MKSLLFLFAILGLALSDKSEKPTVQTVTGTVEKVPVDTKVNHKSGSFSAPAPSPTYSAPSPSYSAPSPTYSAPSPSYSAPSPSYSAPANSGQSYAAPSPSYGASPNTSPAGEVGSQGYYYYYYPVVNQGESHHSSSSYHAAESSDSGLSGLFAGKGIILLLALGAIIILAVAGSAVTLNNGRSIKDLTEATAEKLDVITGLVVDAIDLYDSVN